MPDPLYIPVKAGFDSDSDRHTTNVRAIERWAALLAEEGNIARSTTQVTFANTVAKQTLFSYDIPAFQPKTGDLYRVTIGGSALNNSGLGVTYTFRVEFGTTIVLATAARTFGTSANRRIWRIQAEMLIQSDAAQDIMAEMLVGTAVTDTWAVLGATESSVGYGTSSEATNVIKTLAVTGQMGTAAATADIRVEEYVLERIPS